MNSEMNTEIEKMQFTETFEMKKVCYLLDTYKFDKKNTDDVLLRKTLNKILFNNGILHASFSSSSKCDRMFAKTLSIQQLSKDKHNFLLPDNVIDIDIINAGCSIMYKICVDNDLKCDMLKKYVNDRDNIINKYYDGDKDKCKTFINENLFWQNERKYSNIFEKKIHKCIIDIQNFVYEHEKYDFITKIETECNNPKGKFMSSVIYYEENILLQNAMSKYGVKNVYCPMFDGFNAYKKDDFDVSTLNDGYIKWCIKPTKTDINMPYDYKFNINDTKCKMYNLEYETTDDNFSQIIYKFMGDDFIFQNNTLYCYFKEKWYVNNTNISKLIIKQCIIHVCEHKLKTLKNELKTIDICDENKIIIEQIKNNIKNVNNMKKSICNDSKLNAVLNMLKNTLSGRLDNVQFDISKPDVFVFENIAFDLRTKKQVNITKLDYITMNSGYSYVKPSRGDVDIIDKLFDSIFPDVEMKRTYISILRSALSAHRIEKFFICNGRGRNGKGVINELMMATCGNYGYKMHVSLLTDKIKSGANEEASQLNLKRFLVCNEPNDNEQLNVGNIKKLTGDDVLNARALYSSKTDTKLCSTLIFECNSLINIACNRIDEALVERFVSVLFKMYFTNNEEELENNIRARRGDPFYKTDEFKNKFKCALFDYLLYSKDELYICDESKQHSKEYLYNNDDFLNWFNDNYEQTNKSTDFINVKDVYNMYKDSDLFINLSKVDKRRNNYKKFCETISTHIELRKKYNEKYRYSINGKQSSSIRALIGYKLKEQQEQLII